MRIPAAHIPETGRRTRNGGAVIPLEIAAWAVIAATAAWGLTLWHASAVIRQVRADAFIARAAHHISSLQAVGMVSPAIDAPHVAMALTAMVGRYAYLWLVAQTDIHAETDMSVSLKTVTLLWGNALGLPTDAWLETYEGRSDFSS